jgi:hypothetical protein
VAGLRRLLADSHVPDRYGRIEGGPVHLGLAPTLLAMMLLVLWTGPGDRSLVRRLVVR